MTTTISFTERVSEAWLLERTYHAQLRNGRELSVPDLTKAMKTMTNCYVPVSMWQEISQEEAYATYQRGSPLLLYSEHSWEHPKDAFRTWRPNRNMRVMIYGDAREPVEAISGTDYAICYLDVQRGNGSNASWRAWFSSEINKIFNDSAPSAIIFLRPSVQFPYTTHYTVIACEGHVYEYAARAEAIRGFQALLPQEVSNGNDLPIVFPQLCYYHEVSCPDGVYHLEFFGPRMDEPGYKVT